MMKRIPLILQCLKGCFNRLIFVSLLSVSVLFSSFLRAEDAPVPATSQVTQSLTSQGLTSTTAVAKNVNHAGVPGIPAITMKMNPDGSEDYSINLQILALMTMLGFLPAMVILMTSFTRIVVVMSILRQAMGLQQTPSNQVIIGIALFLTFFIMSPVFHEINQKAVQPYLNEQIKAKEAFQLAQEPMRADRKSVV